MWEASDDEELTGIEGRRKSRSKKLDHRGPKTVGEELKETQAKPSKGRGRQAEGINPYLNVTGDAEWSEIFLEPKGSQEKPRIGGEDLTQERKEET